MSRLLGRVLLAGALLAAGGCRATSHASEALDVEVATLLGWRQHGSDWENSDVPVAHVDATLTPRAWPLGFELALDLSGSAGDQEGEQTAGFGLGVARTLELVEERLWARLGLAREFLETDEGGLPGNHTDAWQATCLSAGLYACLNGVPPRAPRFGIEARYTSGDGPELGARELEGEFLDLYLVVAWGP